MAPTVEIGGTLFLIICGIRQYLGHLTKEHHVGFEAAAWYWHFLDVPKAFFHFVRYPNQPYGHCGVEASSGRLCPFLFPPFRAEKGERRYRAHSLELSCFLLGFGYKRIALVSFPIKRPSLSPADAKKSLYLLAPAGLLVRDLVLLSMQSHKNQSKELGSLAFLSVLA
ncbi:hypothetical protein V6N13_009320 [Hibiscus sabdariffa]